MDAVTLDLRLKEVKAAINAVLISSGKEITEEQLRRDFLMFVGCQIPFKKFGYSTLNSFLRSLPDVVTFRENFLLPVVSSQIADITALLLKQLPPKLSSASAKPTKSWKTILPNDIKDKHAEPPDNSPLSSGELIVPSAVQFMLYKILSKHPEGVKLKDVETLINSKYPLMIYGIPDIKELVESVPHLAKLSNGLVVFTEEKQLQIRDELQENTFPVRKHNNPCISSEIIANFQKILDECPDGVWCTDLPQKYWEKFDSPLKFQTYGYGSVVQMAGDLPEVFHVVRPKSSDYLLLDGRKNLPSYFSEYNVFNVNSDLYEDFIDDLEDLETHRKNVLRLIRGFFSIYEPLFLNHVTASYREISQPTIRVGIHTVQYVLVRVGDIINPYNFWVQLCDLERINDLKALQYQMQSYYAQNKYKYRLPKIFIKSDQMCAHKYENEWRRARILKHLNDDETEVFYIDYGTKGKAKEFGLRFLVDKFSALPAQAVKCSLTNIKPSNGQDKWSPTACERFLEMVTEKLKNGLLSSSKKLVIKRKHLYAAFTSFNPLERRYCCALVDTSSDQDFHINDHLVLEGHADFIERGGL